MKAVRCGGRHGYFRRSAIAAIETERGEDQLGLQLEPEKTPIDGLAIDHAEKVPIAN
jgi:uncharacterized protein (TIGR03435 family)